MFSTQSDNCAPIVHIFDIIFLFAAELEEPKMAYEVNGQRKTMEKGENDCNQHFFQHFFRLSEAVLNHY